MACSPTRFPYSVLLSCTLLLAGAPPGPAAEKEGDAVADGWCGFSVAVAGPWRRAPLRDYAVPGAARCAWAGPNGASVVVFLQEPGAAVSPRALLDGSTKSLTGDLAAAVAVQAVRPVAGMRAMWLVATGKGTGGALDGKGAVETTQHWVAVPRERDVVVVLLTCPAGDYGKLRASFEAAVGSLKVTGSQTAEQKAAE